MLLQGREGSELRLGIVGYRFPEERVDPWDSNSLLVALRVVSPRGTWEVVDPCLTTWEVEGLTRWLAGLAIAPGGSSGAFTSPNLALAAHALPEDATQVRLHVLLELERRPPWATGGALSLELDVPRERLVAAALSLSEDLHRFPQRGEDPTR